MAQQKLETEWDEFDLANGQLALSKLDEASPAHVAAIRNLLRSGKSQDEIVKRFTSAFPTWEGHANYIRLACRVLGGE